MAIEFDFKTLNLSAGAHTITVRAKANGLPYSEPSNAVSYIVAEETVQVRGTWFFDPLPNGNAFSQSVNFVSNGENYNSMSIEVGAGGFRLSYDTKQVAGIEPITPGGDGNSYWADEAYRTITFDGTQTVSKEFYKWLVENAEPYTVSGTWRFNDVPQVAKQKIVEYCAFTTESGYYCTRITISPEKAALYRVYFNAGGKSGYEVGRGWDSGCQVITFDGTQHISQDFYEWLIANAVQQTITFTIGGTQYTALSGMTWSEWVDSEYNTRGFKIAYGNINLSGQGTVEDIGGDTVSPNDVIIANYSYKMGGTHGGGSS